MSTKDDPNSKYDVDSNQIVWIQNKNKNEKHFQEMSVDLLSNGFKQNIGLCYLNSFLRCILFSFSMFIQYFTDF